MMRGSLGNELMVIQPPHGGYGVPFLRDAAGLGQAIAFIRPIQTNLDMQPESESPVCSSEVMRTFDKIHMQFFIRKVY